MLQTRRDILDVLFYTHVSSPQGNATNTNIALAIAAANSTFQVPKGMLQTYAIPHGKSNCFLFQVPKGMLQTYAFPRCFSNSFLFQVPKGMLQTLVATVSMSVTSTSFKSPRECYKPNVQFRFLYRQMSFKSPRECYKP